jgi:hypothetical protein
MANDIGRKMVMSVSVLLIHSATRHVTATLVTRDQLTDRLPNLAIKALYLHPPDESVIVRNWN